MRDARTRGVTAAAKCGDVAETGIKRSLYVKIRILTALHQISQEEKSVSCMLCIYNTICLLNLITYSEVQGVLLPINCL